MAEPHHNQLSIRRSTLVPDVTALQARSNEPTSGRLLSTMPKGQLHDSYGYNDAAATLHDWLNAYGYSMKDQVHQDILKSAVQFVNFEHNYVEVELKYDEELVFDGKEWIKQKITIGQEVPSALRPHNHPPHARTLDSVPTPQRAAILYGPEVAEHIEKLTTVMKAEFDEIRRMVASSAGRVEPNDKGVPEVFKAIPTNQPGTFDGVEGQGDPHSAYVFRTSSFLRSLDIQSLEDLMVLRDLLIAFAINKYPFHPYLLTFDRALLGPHRQRLAGDVGSSIVLPQQNGPAHNEPMFTGGEDMSSDTIALFPTRPGYEEALAELDFGLGAHPLTPACVSPRGCHCRNKSSEDQTAYYIAVNKEKLAKERAEHSSWKKVLASLRFWK